MAKSEEEFKFYVWELLKGLSQNGQHIDLKLEKEAAI